MAGSKVKIEKIKPPPSDKYKWKDMLTNYNRVLTMDAKNKNSKFKQIMGGVPDKIKHIKSTLQVFYKVCGNYYHGSAEKERKDWLTRKEVEVGFGAYKGREIEIEKESQIKKREWVEQYIEMNYSTYRDRALSDIEDIKGYMRNYNEYYKNKMIKTSLDKAKKSFVDILDKCVQEKERHYNDIDYMLKHVYYACVAEWKEINA